MKRHAALAFVFALMLVLAGYACPASSADASSKALKGTAGALVPHKLGVIFYGVDDPFAAQVYRDVNRAAKILGSEVVWAIGSMDPVGQINDAENLIAAGCEGIMCIPNGETATQKIMEVCERNNVYFSICFRNIADEEIAAQVVANSHWVGYVNEPQYKIGETVIRHLYDLGARKIGLLLGVGDQAYEVYRNRAFREVAEKLGMEILATSTPINGTNDAEVATENFLTSYPEMDGIAQVTGAVGQAEMLISTVQRLGKAGQVKVGVCDTFIGEYDAFAADAVHITAGGFSYDGLFSFMWLYNSVDGHPWTDKRNPELIQSALFITSADECKIYDKYVDTPKYNVYSDEVVLNLVKRLNPDVTLDSVQALMNDFGFDYVTKNAVPAD